MRSALLVLFSFLLAQLALAQAHLVKDINTNPADLQVAYDGSNPYTTVGNYVAFPVERNNVLSSASSLTLWITDGTAQGTRMVYAPAKARPGSRNWANLNNNLMYIDNDGAHPLLKKYNPETKQTTVVKEFDHPISLDVIRSGDVLLFSTPTDTSTEFWKTDGTEAGTVMFKTLPFPTSPFGSIYKKASDGGSLSYFVLMPRDNYKLSLWRTDGTDDGTFILMDGIADFDPNYWMLYATGNDAWFGLQHPGFMGNELWKSDGTLEGTTKIKATYSQAQEYTTARVGSKVFSAAYGLLLVSDGTPGGTTELFTSVDWATEYKGLYYFIGADAGIQKNYLGKSDGTEAGTMKVIDLTEDFIFNNSPFYRLADKLLVPLQLEGKGTELGITDGTAEGTVLVKDIRPGEAGSNIRSFAPLGNNKMVFVADDGEHGFEPWVTDGTAEGTHLIVDAMPGTSGSAGEFEARYGMAKLGDRLSFIANQTSGGSGGEVWTTDGTEENTKKSYTYVDHYIGTLNGDVYYESSRKIIKISAATQEATVLKDLAIPSATGGGYALSNDSWVVNNKLIFNMYYYGSDEAPGQELFVTDGTTEGTHIIKDIYPGTGSGNVNTLARVVWNDKFYFAGDDGEHGAELWVTDGTEAGTSMVADVKPGADPSYPNTFRVINNKLFFLIGGGDNPLEMWESDGTTDGTKLAFELFEDHTALALPVVFKNELFIGARMVGGGWQLWKTNGTKEGTVMVKQVSTSDDFKYRIQSLTANSDRLYFAADDGEHGQEVWVSDGTTAGTKILDVTPGAAGTLIDDDFDLFEGTDDLIYFSAANGLWRTAGTVELTEKVYDTVLGLRKVNDQLYFFPLNKDYGVELFVMPFTRFGQSIVFEELTDKKTGDADFMLSASATSGRPVTFTATPSGRVTITNNSVKILKPGSITITANQMGNMGINAAEESQVICINPAKPVVSLKEDKGSSKVLESSAAEGNQWYINGTAIAGATATTYEAKADGVYSVASTVDGCAGEASSGMGIALTGLEDEVAVSVYPNPAKDKLNIQWNRNVVSVAVIDTKGHIKMNTSFVDNTELDLSDFPAGFYLLRLSAGEKQVIKKFIKE